MAPICPASALWGCSPVKSDARVGQQRPQLYISDSITPSPANASILGGRISDPVTRGSANPRSSVRIRMMLGRSYVGMGLRGCLGRRIKHIRVCAPFDGSASPTMRRHAQCSAGHRCTARRVPLIGLGVQQVWTPASRSHSLRVLRHAWGPT